MNGLSYKWLERLMNLCVSAEIAAGNKDLTKRERDHLCQVASEVKAEVIAQINKRRA
jgi:hypothetical protein